MVKRRKKSKNILLHSIELAGKPIFFLFTIFVVLLYSYFHLLKLFTHRFIGFLKRLRLPKFTYPTYQLPRFHLSLPSFRLPRTPKFAIVILTTILIFALTGSLTYWFLFRNLPSPSLLREEIPSLSTKIYDRNGTLLYQVYRDENRTLVKLSDLPPHLINATVASEDKYFYTHRGIDVSGIARAFVSNFQNYYNCYILKGTCYTSLQGGSTITQQLVKNALLSPERTVTRKLKEAYLSLWTERLYSKDEILELYFNYVPYGGTAYGIEEAAHQYFGKSARDLNLSESSLLAGLPVAPTTLSPFGTRPYLAKHRQSQVLEAMVEMQYLSDAEALVAKEASLAIRPQGIEIKAPHFVMYVKELLVEQFGEDVVSRGGLEVTTTLDWDKQQLLEHEINSELLKLKSLRVGNAAGLITSPKTGEILAMAGSHNFFDTERDGQVNVTLQPRQPGSSIKPITYTLALLSGLSPTSYIEDSPICFRIPGQPNYCPSNYDGRFHGRVTLRTALASSYNIPAIKLLNSLGVSNMVKLAREMGITTWNDTSRFGLSLTLGGGEVTMYDMAQVYSVFASGGVKVPLQAIVSVRDHAGEIKSPDPIAKNGNQGITAKAESQTDNEQVIPESIAYQISSILSDPLARAPAFGTRSVLNIPGHQVAVKTGTTNNLRDNWTIGYTPDLLVATWVGNNDNTPMSSVASGITGASPIWSNTMKELLKDSPAAAFQPPKNLLPVKVCSTDGSAFCDGLCQGPAKTEYFLPGTEPKKDCSARGQISEDLNNSR